MKFYHRITALALISTMLIFTPACSLATFVKDFEQYSSEIVPAVNAILAILQFFGVTKQASLPVKIDADVAILQKLVSDFSTAKLDAQPGIRNLITAEEATLNADLAQVFAIGQISDPNSQKKIAALVQLIESAVQEAEALIPQTTAGLDKSAAKAAAANFKPNDIVGSFNAILTAKTGNPGVDSLTPKLKLRKHHSLLFKIGTLNIVR